VRIRIRIGIAGFACAAFMAMSAEYAGAGTHVRSDYAGNGYWPTFGYIPGGPYVYVPPARLDLPREVHARRWSGAPNPVRPRATRRRP
jgi:hypothetical protein